MPESFTVTLNEDAPQDIEAPRSFEATGDFDVFLKNEGEPMHVHLRLDPTLSAVGQVETPNRYVESERTRRVRVSVTEGERPVEGRLEIVTGYGANTAYVGVTVREELRTDDGVEVDERLAEPPPKPEPVAPEPQRLLLFAVVAVLVLLAVATALLTQEVVVTTIVVIVVLFVGGVAAFLLS